MRNYILSALCFALVNMLMIGMEAAYGPNWWLRLVFIAIVAYTLQPVTEPIADALERRRKRYKRRSAYYALVEAGK